MIETFRKNKWEIILVSILLLVSAVAHGYNMFHFPYYENDEGTYMSQAWSISEEGKLAPYTYWYDHAPGGWFLIAAWSQITGGFFTFDLSINGGRVLMLVLHVLATALLYFITRRLSKSVSASCIATLLFALSPLGLFFHRRVLLDNIMTFWVLGAVAILLVRQLKLKHVILSGLLFGIAVLTKENAVFFGPALLYLVYIRAHNGHKRFAISMWLIISGLLISIYFVYALFKGELFPPGTFGSIDHVSLIKTLQFQASRKAQGSFWDFSTQSSDFWLRVFEWAKFDAFLIVGGAVAIVALFMLGLVKRKYSYVFIAGIYTLGLFFLARGGIILDFYIIPMIPLMAMALGVSWTALLEALLGKYVIFRNALNIIIIACVLVVCVNEIQNAPRGNPFITNSTESQIAAINWVRQNVPENSFVAIDNYSYLDLNAPENPSGKLYQHAEWYWKIDNDIEISRDILKNDFRNIDVIVMTPQMDYDVKAAGMKLMGTALGVSKPAVIYSGSGWDVIVWYPRHENGVLNRSWNSYKKEFINTDGMVIDPSQPTVGTSEAQAYALLRAVWMNDKETFDNVYHWTEEHLKNNNGLFAWRYMSEGDVTRRDDSSASDADENIALALLFASKQWNEIEYLRSGKALLGQIWEHEVAYYNNTHYLVAGEWAKGEKVLTINPSYLSPAHYRIFADADPLHPWKELVDSSYEAIEKCMNVSINNKKGRLPPEWCSLNMTNGKYGTSLSPQPTDTFYGFNAFRVPWHLALDLKWSNEQHANKLLGKFDLLKKEWDNNARISATYTHEGEVWDNYESVAAYAGNIGIFMATDLKSADDIYQKKILEKFYENSEHSYWDDPKNYYTQNWAWFGTALYKDALPNLWVTVE